MRVTHQAIPVPSLAARVPIPKAVDLPSHAISGMQGPRPPLCACRWPSLVRSPPPRPRPVLAGRALEGCGPAGLCEKHRAQARSSPRGEPSPASPPPASPPPRPPPPSPPPPPPRPPLPLRLPLFRPRPFLPSVDLGAIPGGSSDIFGNGVSAKGGGWRGFCDWAVCFGRVGGPSPPAERAVGSAASLGDALVRRFLGNSGVHGRISIKNGL